MYILTKEGHKKDKWVCVLAYTQLKFQFIDHELAINEKAKETVLKRWLGWGQGVKQGAQDLLACAVKMGRFDVVKLLVDANVPTADLLMDLGKSRRRGSARHVINAGGDVAAAVS